MITLMDNGANTRVYGKTVQGKNIIGGKEVEAETRFQSKNPAQLNDIVGVFPETTPTQLEEACKVASKAFRDWKHVPAPVRAEIIGNIGQRLTKEKELLSRVITREIGKTLKEARGSVQEAIDTCNFFQSEGRRLYGQTVPSEMPNKDLFTFRRPYGVVGIITAGNFPIAVPSWKIIPALLCGNTVVWKPSEDAPTIAYLFAKICLEAGLPDGVLNLVNGQGPTVGKNMVGLIDKGYFQKFSFTGSSAVGRTIGEACGRNLIQPSLELGGKNPCIIMEDADLELALQGAVWGTYGTAGQRCTSTGNIIVHKKIAGEFKKRFRQQVEAIRIGNPFLDESVLYGPMINERFYNTYQAHFAMGDRSKATKMFGNGPIKSKSDWGNFSGDPTQGYFMTPACWENVSMESEICQTEIFGPTVNIVEIESIDEAMAACNGTRYGLSSAMYTTNMNYAYRFMHENQAGMGSVNNSTTGAEAHLPFGGNKESGNGTRESGIWVIDAYTYYQAINVDSSGKLQLAQMDTQYVKPTTASEFTGVVAMP